MLRRLTRPPILPFLLALLILLPLYLTTLQTIPNGAEHYYTIDVGETQIVLNSWGTLHATGYPLYVMIGNVLVAILRLAGVSPATAPGITSLIYGITALIFIYALAVNVITPSPPAPLPQGEGSKIEQSEISTGRYWLAAGMVLLFGLTRTVWIHQAIAEIYSFGLLLLAWLLLVALWQRPIRGRVYWLALIGGFGVFHHRALLMVAPALLYAVWREVFTSESPVRNSDSPALSTQHSALSTILLCLLLGLLGFVPYAYLPLRAQTGAGWVYGQPNSWDGFWDQFLGREASRFIGASVSLEGLLANFTLVNTVLVTDLTVPGIVLGLLGLVLALRNPARRRVAVTMLLSGGVAYGFHVLLYTDILSALILPITLSLAFGWLWLAEWILIYIQQIRIEPQRHRGHRVNAVGLPETSITMMFVIGAAVLINQNWEFIHELTSNRTGLETIELAKGAPRGSTLMLDWGPRHFAVGFARDVQGELPDITLVDHKVDFQSLVYRDGRKLVTADFTFYNRPVSWWEEQLGAQVYLHSVAPHLIKIAVQPEMVSNQLTSDGILIIEPARLVCAKNTLNLHVAWVSGSQPNYDLSVFVHLLDSGGIVIAQADQSAPVYGWRPLTSWEAGEVVRDIYPLPRLPDGERIAYGLYRQLNGGEFVNEYEYEMSVKCDD